MEGRLLLAILVDTLADEVEANGFTSLREAIARAASNPGDDVITFAPGLSGKIDLALGELMLDDWSGRVTIEASQAVNTIDAGGVDRVFYVSDWTTAALNGLTITGGEAGGYGNGGGGIYNRGTLTLTGSTVTGNRSAGYSYYGYSYGGDGGGILNMAGSLTLVGSTVSGNVADLRGGGIASFPVRTGYSTSRAGTVTLIDSTVSGNTAGDSGGGVANLSKSFRTGSFIRFMPAGAVSLVRTTLSDNRAGSNGGGLYNREDAFPSSSSVTVADSTISGNSAGRDGGGLGSLGVTTTITVSGSTFSGNSAGRDGGGLANGLGRASSLTNTTISGNSAGGNGGGLVNSYNATLTHVTVTDNEAGGLGGGVFQTSSFSTLNLNCSIVSGNRLAGDASSRDDLAVTDGSILGVGNVVGTGGGGLLAVSNALGVLDPRLGPLADNGGPTLTRLPMPDSPAVDGAQFLPTPVTTDQRGFDRPRGLRPDAGAVELDTGDPPPREAASLVVTTLDDVLDPFDQQTSIREAIALAKGTPGDDTITFANGLAGTIHLGGFGTLVLDDPSGAVSIDDASRAITIDAGGVAQVFRVPAGATVNLLGLTITGGRSKYEGGGIYNRGALTLTGVTIAGNSAGTGGGVNNFFGTLTLIDSTVSGNSATFSGGGVQNLGTMTVIGSSLVGNAAAGGGAGISNAATLTMVGSTVSGNSAGYSGGGVSNSGTLTLTNSTISGNSTPGAGGGLQSSGTATLTHVTITDNRAGNGGGLWQAGYGGSLTLYNSIVSGNRRDGQDPAPDDLAAPAGIARGVGNLVGTGGGALNAAANLLGVVDPRLGPLADNGGPTLTHLPLADSPAIDGGRFLPTNVATDQRGAPRPRGRSLDVGAVEVDTGPPGELEAGGTVVTTRDDGYDPYDGLTSIREAIAFAAAHPGDDTITFDPSLAGTIDLETFGELVLDDATGSVTIQASPGVTTIDARGLGRVLRVEAGTTASVVGLTLRGGAAVGGGVYNHGTLALTDSTVTGNSSWASGGGVVNTGTLTMASSTISSNTAAGSGGGVFNTGTLTLVDSTVSGNSAVSQSGGIDNQGVLTLIGVTVSGNRSAGYSYYGYTFGGYGGAITNRGTATLISSTISGNSAAKSGGGVANFQGRTTLTNTIIAGNTRADGTADDIGGDAAYGVTGIYSLVGAGGSGGLQDGVDGNIVGVADPLLAPLGDYGGPTWTMPLLPGSRAIDAGGGAGLPSSDQRGLGRVGAPDIGAFESQGFRFVVLPGSTPQTTVVGDDFANPLGVVVTAANPVEPVAGGLVDFVAIPSSGGASATFAATATIQADGTSSVVATAGATLGSYSVVASAAGVANPALFALTNTPASVTAVSVAWGSAGSSALETAGDGLRLLAAGRTTTLPWSGIRSITITFDGAPPLAPSDVKVTGEAVADYGPVTISRSGTTYTITLARPITSADRVTIAIANPSISTFIRRLDVLPGDVNDNGSVDAIDLMLVRRALTASDPQVIVPLVFLDIDGDGVVDADDYNLARRNVGTRLRR